jgi:hypothetical protein
VPILAAAVLILLIITLSATSLFLGFVLGVIGISLFILTKKIQKRQSQKNE